MFPTVTYVYLLYCKVCVVLFLLVKLDSKMALIDALPVLIKTVSISKLEVYLSRQLLELFGSRDPPPPPSSSPDRGHQRRLAALWGLVAAVKVNDPPQNVTLLLFQTLEQLYKLPEIRNRVSAVDKRFVVTTPELCDAR